MSCGKLETRYEYLHLVSLAQDVSSMTSCAFIFQVLILLINNDKGMYIKLLNYLQLNGYESGFVNRV